MTSLSSRYPRALSARCCLWGGERVVGVGVRSGSVVFCQDFHRCRRGWAGGVGVVADHEDGVGAAGAQRSSFAGVAQCHDAEGAILAVWVRHSGSSAGAVEVLWAGL